MYTSVQQKDPGSFCFWNPLRSPACQSPKTAPPGSAACASTPALPTLTGSVITWPPACRILVTVAAMSSVAK